MPTPSYYLYYRQDSASYTIDFGLEEFESKEELNKFLQTLEDVTYIKVIAGFCLTERGA